MFILIGDISLILKTILQSWKTNKQKTARYFDISPTDSGLKCNTSWTTGGATLVFSFVNGCVFSSARIKVQQAKMTTLRPFTCDDLFKFNNMWVKSCSFCFKPSICVYVVICMSCLFVVRCVSRLIGVIGQAGHYAPPNSL